MDVAVLIVRLAFAAIFSIAGIAKLFDPEGSRKAFSDFGVPAGLGRPLAVLLPAAELAIAVSMFFVSSSWLGGIAAAALLGGFTVGMLIQLAKGNAPDCHCFGQLHSEPVGAGSVVRNAVMLAAAGFLVARGQQGQGPPLVNTQQDLLLLIIGIGLMSLLLAVVLYLKKISEQQVQIIRRVELLELIGQEAGVEREDAGHPLDTLPIGAIVPGFEGEDLDGEKVSLERLNGEGLPLIFFYVGPNCAPCQALAPEMAQWKKEFEGKARFALISSGKAKENRAKFDQTLADVIILQKEKEISDLLHFRWTPSALLVGSDGRVAGHVVAGDTAIRQLIDKIRADITAGGVTYFSNNDHARVKVGEPVPEIEIVDTAGRKITSADFIGKQTLVAFWSTGCPHCADMLPDLRDWDIAKGDDAPNLILFTDGDMDMIESAGLRSPVVLDEGHRTSTKFGMFGTPSAVLVDENGIFVSETAAGAPNIWSLIGRRNGKAH